MAKRQTPIVGALHDLQAVVARSIRNVESGGSPDIVAILREVADVVATGPAEPRVSGCAATGCSEHMRVAQQIERAPLMAKRQTRRTISVKGTTYKRLQNYCEQEGLSVSGFLETVMGAKLDALGVPVPELPPAKPQRAAPEPPEHSAHFTF